MNELFEQLDFRENPMFEAIISDLINQKFSIVDHFFMSDEVDALRASLLERYESEEFKKAAIGNRTNEIIKKSVRGDYIKWIDESQKNDAESTFFDKVNELIAYLNKTCFLGILQKEFHYAIYPKGTFYKRHLDTFQNDDRRKLSFVFYLNTIDWKPENGGELVLYLDNNGIEIKKVIHPFPGRVVIFESQEIEHEVMTVLSDERYSITGWMKTR